ncbi:MAG: DUF6989 domain-containing protein [Promethearchaeota archaeon]|jgi:hypothetical protein
MKLKLSQIERDALLVHVVFIISCVVILLIPLIQIGTKLFILVIIYNILVPFVGLWRREKEWISIWLFAFIISLFQIWPDWILSAELNILVFPEDGLFKIGTVSGYMLGLWTIPLFLILFMGKKIQERFPKKYTYLVVSVMSFLIFGIAEQSMWTLQSWHAQNVVMIGRIALYIIVPEIVLGLSTYYFYEMTKEKSHWLKIPVAFSVMIIYLGNAIFFYFLIESVIFT